MAWSNNSTFSQFHLEVLFVFALRRISSFVICFVYEILSVFLRNYISADSSLFNKSALSVHALALYNNVYHMLWHFSNIYLNWILMLIFLRTFSNDVNTDIEMDILRCKSCCCCRHHPSTEKWWKGPTTVSTHTGRCYPPI